METWEVITTNAEGKPWEVEAYSFYIKLPHNATDRQVFNVLRTEGHITSNRTFGEKSVHTGKTYYRFRRSGGKIWVIFKGRPEYFLQRTSTGAANASWVHYKKRRHPKAGY